MTSHSHDEMVTVLCSPVWALACKAIEVTSSTLPESTRESTRESTHESTRESTREEASPPASPPDETNPSQAGRARPAPRPTTQEMMASMKALRQQRANADEAEIVLDEIVRDSAPGSLMNDVRRAV